MFLNTIKWIVHPIEFYNAIKTKWLTKFGTPKSLASHLYMLAFGEKINWEHPKDLNQWINWIAFNTDTSKWSILADKYKVREYVKEKGYGDTLVPVLDVWDDPEKISFENLPNEFVIKINNGSGDVIIVKDKTKTNIDEIKSYFKSLYDHPYGKDTAEPHYLKIKPIVMAEKLLDSSKQAVDSKSLVDYKFFTINQKTDYCLVISNRNKGAYSTGVYSIPDWKYCSEYTHHDNHHTDSQTLIPKPQNLDKMIEMSKVLAEGFKFVRMDFYEVDNKVYFGEMTFTPVGGRIKSITPDLLVKLGSMIQS